MTFTDDCCVLRAACCVRAVTQHAARGIVCRHAVHSEPRRHMTGPPNERAAERSSGATDPALARGHVTRAEAGRDTARIDRIWTRHRRFRWLRVPAVLAALALVAIVL